MFLDRAVKWLLPRNDRFFLYMQSIAKAVEEGANIFAEFRTADSREKFTQISERLRRKEHETDELAHLLYEELDKTFVTPIDREDLHALTSALDDVLDLIERCANHIVIYKLKSLTEPMKELLRVSQSAATEVTRCIEVLQDVSKIDEIQVHVIHVNSLENEGDKIYRKALESLFEDAIDPIELLRQKEILDMLEDTIDACEDVMDLIRSVVVKNG
jgi:predicted phosphate transport protein (TIGR00153 family)